MMQAAAIVLLLARGMTPPAAIALPGPGLGMTAPSAVRTIALEGLVAMALKSLSVPATAETAAVPVVNSHERLALEIFLRLVGVTRVVLVAPIADATKGASANAVAAIEVAA
jgi:hypothetical protein